MVALTKDHSLDRAEIAYALSYIGVAADAVEIYKGSFLQQSAAGYAVMAGDPLATGPIIAVAEKNVPDQTGASNGDATVRGIVGQFTRPIATASPVTDADMLGPVYAANNHDVCSDNSKPLLGIMVGINNEAGTCTVLISGAVNKSLGTGLVLLIDEVIDYSDFTAAALTEEINLGSPIPTNAIPFVQRNKLITPFTHATATTAVLEVGNDGDDDAYDSGGDIFTGSAFTGLVWFRGGPGAGIGSPAYDGTATGQITATVTIDAGTVDSFTDGSVRVQIWGFIL